MKRYFTGSIENPFYGFSVPDIKPVYQLDQSGFNNIAKPTYELQKLHCIK